ncbi:hypothetical protein BB561_006859, partial [Smittium simulii]
MLKTNNSSVMDDSQPLLQVAKRSLMGYSKATKAITLSGSDKIIGCSWDQFATDTVAAIDYVTNFVGNTYIVVEQNKITRTTYFNFSNVKDAENFYTVAIVYNDRLVDLYQTVKSEGGTQNITIPSFKKVNIINLLAIADVSAFKLRIKNVIHLFGLKFLFKISNEKFEISSFLEIDNELMAMTYKGCNAASSSKGYKQNNLAKTAVKLPTNTEFNIKKLLDESEKNLAAANVAILSNHYNLEQKNGLILQKSDKIDCDFEDKPINKSAELPNITLKNSNTVANAINVIKKNTNINIKLGKLNGDLIILKKEDQNL